MSGSRTLELDAPATVTVDPDSRTHRYGGLTLGIVGIVMIPIGFVAMISNSCFMSYCEDQDRDAREETYASIGGLVRLGGLVATPLGWIMYGTSRSPEIEVQYSGTSMARLPPPSAWSVGVLPTRGGLSLGGQVAF